MKWILFACTIIIYSISVFDAVLTVYDTLGSTITLECSHSKYETITWRGPYLGNAVYATLFGINTNLPEELHARLFVSMNQTNRKTVLRIVNVQIIDEGSYECSAEVSRSIESFNLQLPGLFRSNDPTYNRFLLIDNVFNKLIVGQMNAIRLIDIHDKPVFPAQSTTINFDPEGSKLSYCILQKSEIPNCQNHIKFIAKKTNDTFILCGTNANSPTGYEFNITDNSQVNTGDVPCSNDPFDNFTAIYATSYNLNSQALMYYGATKNGESTISRPIYGNDSNVQDYMKGDISNKWMKDPQFVGSFDINDRVIFFFREVAIEEEPFKHTIYSRVAKVCKEDIGGDSMLRNKWTGYQKARLNCSIPGDFPITFDVLQDVVSTDNAIFYGLFTSGVGIPASAICAFNISELEKAFNGQFKAPQVDSLYHWTAATSVPTPRPGVCTNDSLSTSNNVLSFIVEHPLMYETVQPMYDKPVFVMDDVELQQLELHGNTSDVIFYAASNTGTVYKLLLKKNTTYLSSTVSPFDNSEVIWSMKQHGDYLYIGTDNTVRHIKVINCEQYRWIDSCVKDPHCSWINDANLLPDSPVEDEIQCYNRCRPLSFVKENGLTNNPGVYSHTNYDLSRTTPYSCCPSEPTQLQVIKVHKTKLKLRWMAGFNGGFKQTFIVEHTTEETMSWISKKVDFNGIDSDPHTFELQGLNHSTTYSIRLYAENKMGQSTKTSSIVVATKATTAENKGKVQHEKYVDEQNNDEKDEEDASGQIFLNIVGGVSLIFNLVSLGILGYKCYKCKHKAKGEPQCTNNVDENNHIERNQKGKQHSKKYVDEQNDDEKNSKVSHDDVQPKGKMFDKSDKDLPLNRMNAETNHNGGIQLTKVLCSQCCKGAQQNMKYVDEYNNVEGNQKDTTKAERKKKKKKRKKVGDDTVEEEDKETEHANIEHQNT